MDRREFLRDFGISTGLLIGFGLSQTKGCEEENKEENKIIQKEEIIGKEKNSDKLEDFRINEYTPTGFVITNNTYLIAQGNRALYKINTKTGVATILN